MKPVNSVCFDGEQHSAHLVLVVEALKTYLVADVSISLDLGAEECGRPLYWGVNPLKNGLVQDYSSLQPTRPLLTTWKRHSRSRRPFP